jgi:glycine cleavage system H protein
VEDGKGTVGVSNHAQESLGDIVYVEVADKGAELTRGDIVGTVESVKAASDIYTPVSGTVIEKNAELDKNPHLVNKSPYDKGELFLPETLTQP